MFTEPDFVEEINLNNIFLRKLSKDDARFFFESLKNEQMTHYLSLSALRSMDHAKKLMKNYIKSWERYIQFNYIIELRKHDKITKIGSVSLWNVSWLHRRAEIGIWILPDYWEKGYGNTALNLIKLIGFNHFMLNRLEAHVAVENLNSISLFKKTGFVLEGTLKKYLNLNNKFSDAHVLACLKD